LSGGGAGAGIEHRRRRGARGAVAVASAAVAPATSATAATGATEAAPGEGGPAGDKPGKVDLFPGGVLQRFAGASPGPRVSDHPGGAPGERVERWAQEAAAEARTRSGQVDHVWRVVERELAGGYHPPAEVVHEKPDRRGARVADRLRSWVQQLAAATVRGPPSTPNLPGSHADHTPAYRSIDPSQENFVGTPAGLNLRAGAFGQQQAAAAASDSPARWLSVEIEVTTDEDGSVREARVVVPSGRRAFDRHALAAVQEAVARGGTRAAVSRWQVEAGYSIAHIDSVGLTFDENALFDRGARLKGRYPLQENVETRVTLRWVMPR
jgi:TonB family protein